MNKSLKLFSVRGIDVRLHITFPLILVWAAVEFGLLNGSLVGALFGVVAIMLLFVLVTLHELGHSFTSQFYGYPVKQIVLTPLGGLAQLTEIPEKPIQEFFVAIAGPAVNVVVAAIMGLFALLANVSISNPLRAISGGAGLSLEALFTYIFVYNIMLAVFNLLPAFPLDGGRIFRSLLAMKLEYVRATNIAAAVGRALAIMLGLFAIFNGNIFLILIAIFIFTAGDQEAQMVRARSMMRGIRVDQVTSRNAYTLTPESTVQQALNLMLLGGGQADFPVLDEDRLVGFVSREALLQAKSTAAPHSYISAIMDSVEPASAGDDLYDVQRRMSENKLNALPVVSAGRYLGLITRQQILSALRMMHNVPDLANQSHSASA
jgi:Zn-dependent protease/predicted transcriptional regulator